MSENIWVSLYYRRFVNGFSKIFRPLNDLLVGSSTNKSKRKKDTFEWGKAHDTAFRTIIEYLSDPPVLAYTDYRRPFKLHIYLRNILTHTVNNSLQKLIYVKHFQYSVVKQKLNIIHIICENFRTVPCALCKIQLI